MAHGVAKPQSRPVGCVVRLRPAPATGSSADTIDDAKTPANSALYRLDPPRAATRIDEGSGVMKGLAFSPDVVARQCGLARQMDYSFSLGAGGAVGSRGPYSYFQGSDGYANGMTLEAEGCLCMPVRDDWYMGRFGIDAAGTSRRDVPVQWPTDCTFDAEELDRLFVATTRRRPIRC